MTPDQPQERSEILKFRRQGRKSGHRFTTFIEAQGGGARSPLRKIVFVYTYNYLPFSDIIFMADTAVNAESVLESR
jgi:hypothetical protein